MPTQLCCPTIQPGPSLRGNADQRFYSSGSVDSRLVGETQFRRQLRSQIEFGNEERTPSGNARGENRTPDQPRKLSGLLYRCR